MSLGNRIILKACKQSAKENQDKYFQSLANFGFAPSSLHCHRNGVDKATRLLWDLLVNSSLIVEMWQKRKMSYSSKTLAGSSIAKLLLSLVF